MRISKLIVQSVRSHKNFAVNFHEQTTVITGKNGAGKTSLIEALYIALRGVSFRGSDKDILRNGDDWYRIDVATDENGVRTVKFDSTRTTGRKQFTIDGKTLYRLSPKYKYPVVLFEPDDLRLLSGSPARRRKFIDHSISQINPQYQVVLNRYERALKQRNGLLKQSYYPNDELFAWNVALSEYGSLIIEERIIFIEKLNQKIQERYAAIAGTRDELSIHYSHTLIGSAKQKLLTELSGNVERDSHLGYTSVGPHRHDLTTLFNKQPIADRASRGELRTATLALKFIEAEVIEELSGLTPILLFDDVFSELDESRQANLADQISYQLVITTAHSPTNTGVIHLE